jgi:hypothetical protein
MRKLAAVAFLLLLLVSCISPGVRFPDWDRPTAIGGIGVIRGARRPVPGPQPVRPCQELARIRCDFLACGGTGYDFVTYQCTGQGRAGRCVANGGCITSRRPAS